MFLFLAHQLRVLKVQLQYQKAYQKKGPSRHKQFIEIATPSRTRNSEEEEVVEVTDSEDEFEDFNQDLSLETSIPNLGLHFSPIIDEMGIQHKSKSSLLELIENQLGRDASGRQFIQSLPLLHLPCPFPNWLT